MWGGLWALHEAEGAATSAEGPRGSGESPRRSAEGEGGPPGEIVKGGMSRAMEDSGHDESYGHESEPAVRCGGDAD